MIDRSTAKLAGYPLCISVPLLAPLGVWLDMPWLALALVFGLCPLLGALVGEDHTLPVAALRRSRTLVAYLAFVPRLYALVWMGVLAWAAAFVSRVDLSVAELTFVTLGVGMGSALAIPAAHELIHRHSIFDMLLARLMTALCL